jgi:serine protease
MKIPSCTKSGLFLLLILSVCFRHQVIAQQIKWFEMPEGITAEDYLPGRIIFKMKGEMHPFLKSQQIEDPEFNRILGRINAKGLAKMFPLHGPPLKSLHSSGQPFADLSGIYSINIPDETSIEDAINILYNSGLVEYAQPYYLPKTFNLVNDPFVSSQYYLNKIKAFDAWSIEKGDSTVVIAIVDTGIDLLHPDLKSKIAYNYDDPVNGKDSDNDGYIDNFHGWNLGSNNNNTQWEVDAHGVHVAGIAGAAANNGTGMAGVGFNSYILPVKIINADGRLSNSYEGIVYSADQGAKVINCSWGGSMPYGQYGQDIINYAVINRDALIIAAAGNSNNQVKIYPASYNNVISVAATNADDLKWSGSSFGTSVDISAPGQGIFSTWINGTYVSSSGTSMAAPVVSGAAAILRAHFPDYNAQQITAQLKITADIIDTIAENLQYKGLLGSGRLNLYRALTEKHHPYLMFTGLQHPIKYYQMFNPGETIELGTEFINILSSADNLYAILTTSSQHIEIVSGRSDLGEINHKQKANNFLNPFLIRIKPTIPASHDALFTVSFFNGEGQDAGRQNFPITFNLDYVDLQAGNLKTTINSKGNIGYNYPNFTQGVGFQYFNANAGRSLLKCAGFICGTSTSTVVDNIYGPAENSFTNTLRSVGNARILENASKGDILISGSFNDSLAGTSRVGVKANYRIYAFDKAPLDKFLIMEYDIINVTNDNKPGFYAGFFADWIIDDVRNHRAAFDAANRMGYAFSSNGGNFTGIQLLSHTNVRHYAFDNQGFSGSLKISDGFTSFEKYTALKSNRENAGIFDKDNDVSSLVSAGPFNLAAGDTLRVAFALLAGDHINDLRSNAQLALMVYNNTYTSSEQFTMENPLQMRVFPNPARQNFIVEFSASQPGLHKVDMYDLNARLVYTHNINEAMGLIRHSVERDLLKPGIYIMQVSNAAAVQSARIIITD